MTAGIFFAQKDRTEKRNEAQIKIVEARRTSSGGLFVLKRIILQKAFSSTFQNVFDTSISPETEVIKEKMRKGPRIGGLFRVCFGLKTADDSRFLHHTKGLHREDKRLLRGEDMKRYSHEYKGEYVWYVPSRMRAHRNTARPGDAERFEQPKVLVKDTTADFAGTYDNQNFYVKDVLIVIPRDGQQAPFDLRYVAGVINSSALRFYYRSTFKTIHVQCEELGSLPLPPIDVIHPADKSRHDRMVQLVDQMLEAEKQLAGAQTERDKNYWEGKCASLDRQIDELVYELYGLTGDEINIVEGET